MDITTEPKKKGTKKTSVKTGVAVSVIIVVVIGIMGVLYTRGLSNEKHHEFCSNWYNQNQKFKQQLDNEHLPSETERALINDQINQYNKECVF